MSRLPTKLGQEPLIDVLFEVRFNASVSAADVLPGVLYSQLGGERKIVRLPVSDIPKGARRADPGLAFAPLIKIEWDSFDISIGDNSLVVSCRMPYPGWKEFKTAILTVCHHLGSTGIVDAVSRYSLKYSDLIPSQDIREQYINTRLKISIGEKEFSEQGFALRLSMLKDDIVHLVDLTTGATLNVRDKGQMAGLFISVDSIIQSGDKAFEAWSDTLSTGLDTLHLSNKEVFFDCLTDEAINNLEPEYEQ